MIAPEDEELIARGEAIYEQLLRTRLEPTHRGEYLAIDPDSGKYFLGRTVEDAIFAARASNPNCQVYTVRVGYDVSAVIGGGWS